MPDYVPKPDGDDSFAGGMDGFMKPSKLAPGMYEAAMNVICRSGVVATRPGSRSILDLPDGNIQGVTLFKPTSGQPCLVFAIDGKVYYSYQPFRTYTQIPGIQFYHASKAIAWAACVKSTDFDSSGNLLTLDQPINVLVMQDGNTRAAFWDGSTGRHLNPTKSGTTVTKDGYDETPVGLWMKWSNNRLWVTRGNKVFASDIGNPLKFTEAQYLNEARCFFLLGDCTAIAETPDRLGIICFTSTTGELLLSSIQDRTQWLSTPNFQQTVFNQVGCISHRSIVTQYGLLWWWTPKGVISQDAALRSYRTSMMYVADNEMIQSKSNLSYDLTGICGTSFENFMLHAVPNGDKLNTRVHVMDQGEEEVPYSLWPSYWTGWRPVEYAHGVILSQERVFFASYDYDGKNRIWEMFTSDRTDNGIPITSYVLTRQYMFGDGEWKSFRWCEVEMAGVSGEVAIMAAIGGRKGALQPVLTKDISAIRGQIYSDRLYGQGENSILGSRPQIRVLRSIDGADPSLANEVDVESDFNGLIDKGFSVLVVWSGVAAISGVRTFCQYKEQTLWGTNEEDETGEENLLTEEGVAAQSLFSDGYPFSIYTSTATYTRDDPVSGDPVTKTATQQSVINQQDADRKASQTAKWYVMHQIGQVP